VRSQEYRKAADCFKRAVDSYSGGERPAKAAIDNLDARIEWTNRTK